MSNSPFIDVLNNLVSEMQAYLNPEDLKKTPDKPTPEATMPMIIRKMNQRLPINPPREGDNFLADITISFSIVYTKVFKTCYLRWPFSLLYRGSSNVGESKKADHEEPD